MNNQKTSKDAENKASTANNGYDIATRFALSMYLGENVNSVVKNTKL